MIKGQILPGSNFCINLQNIIAQYRPLNIVEIGTWRGLGSTKCIIDSIISNSLDCNFISIESNKTFYDEAVENLKNYHQYVTLFYGRIVEIEDVLNFCQNSSVAVNQQWLSNDLEDMRKNQNILAYIPNVIDLLLLDGGEYSTYAEWAKLKNKTKILAMDDITTMKCKHIHHELLNDINYQTLSISNERNGYSIFKNISIKERDII